MFLNILLKHYVCAKHEMLKLQCGMYFVFASCVEYDAVKRVLKISCQNIGNNNDKRSEKY